MHVALLTGAGAVLLAAAATVIVLARRPQAASGNEPDQSKDTDATSTASGELAQPQMLS